MTHDAAPRRAIVPSFRQLAKDHALAAHELTERAASAHYAPEVEKALDLAQLHALVSLACSEVAPPERRACTSRTVDLTPPAVK